MRRLLVVVMTLLLLSCLGACSGDDEGVSGKTTDASARSVDGTIGGIDGAVSDTNSGPIPCTHNGVCDTDAFCALYYNGVKRLKGDGQPPILPGWSNVCEDDSAGKVQEGAICDPFSNDGDQILAACVNPSACMQGICSALCEQDSQCPAETRCGVTEYGAPVSAEDGADAIAWLPIDICVPLPKESGACDKDADCGGSQICRPWVKRVAAAFASEGRCVTPTAGKQPYGQACGASSTGEGLGKLCDSTLCLYASAKSAGVCSQLCESSKDCPDTLTYNGQVFPTVCDSLLTNHAGTSAPEDDVYLPHCVAVNQKSSRDDCEAKRACAGTEACRAYTITWGPDKASALEFRCVELKTLTQPEGPTLDDGASCDPFAGDIACKGGYCLLNTNGTGVCGRLCKDDSACGGGTTCDLKFPLIPRSDESKAALVGMCRG